jgi:hypothetical protein
MQLRASAVVAAVVLAARTARADATPQAGTDVGVGEMRSSLLNYYGGEEASAYVIGGVGVASVGAGAVLVTRSQDFSRGLGWPLLTLGALEVLGGAFYVVQVRSEIHRYGDQLASNPTGYRDVEATHIAGTRRRFVYYRLGELGLAVAGLAIATYGFAANRPTFEGVGVGGVAVGAPFLLIDTFNNARAGWYADRVRRFQPSIGLVPGPSGGLSVAVAGVL